MWTYICIHKHTSLYIYTYMVYIYMCINKYKIIFIYPNSLRFKPEMLVYCYFP